MRGPPGAVSDMPSSATSLDRRSVRADFLDMMKEQFFVMSKMLREDIKNDVSSQLSQAGVPVQNVSNPVLNQPIFNNKDYKWYPVACV